MQVFSLFEVKRSHSVCAQGGINAVLDQKGQHDSIRQHVIDTVKGGEYLANQPPILSMCEDAPGLIRTFERMGVTFSRTPEGLLDQRLFGGVKIKRTAFAGASTGQQLLYGVDQQVRRLHAEGLVTKREFWEFLSLLLDADGSCRGIVAMDLRSLEVRAFPADAVVIASGWLRSALCPQDDDLHQLDRVGGQPLLSAGGLVRQRRVLPVPSHRHDRPGQDPAHERGGPR